MTAEAAVLNKGAVAMAADSKASIRIKGVLKSHDNANKLFTLSKFHPVGIMVNGNAEFMRHPWETLIKLYRDRLREKSLGELHGYADDFLFSLTNDLNFSKDQQEENVFFIIADFFNRIRERADELADRGIEIVKARTRAIDGQRVRHIEGTEKLESMNGITPEIIKELYGTTIQEALKQIFPDDLKISDEDNNKLLDYAYNVLLRDVFSGGNSEVILSGFGDSDIFPSLRAYQIDGVVAGRLRSIPTQSSDISVNKTTAAIHPFAQREMVDRFMTGIDPDYRDYIRRTFSSIMESTASELVEKYFKGTAQEKDETLGAVSKLVREKLTEYFDTARKYRVETFAQPIIDMTESLPKEELAHLAESLVNLTSFKRRVSLDAESVGGPVDVAVISKGDGFIWIKRKHYFKPEFNPPFNRNYFRDHIKANGETAHERAAKRA